MIRNRRFLRLWSAYAANTVGDEIYLLAVPLLAYSQGASASTMALIYSCSILPQAVFGFVGGVMADRGDKVRLMRRVYSTSSVLLYLALLAYMMWPAGRIAVLGLTAVLLGALASVSAAGIDSVLPDFVDRSDLARANSMTEAARTVSTVAGPAIAGFLVASVFPPSAILVNAVAFGVAFFLLRNLSSPTALPSSARETSARADLIIGIRYLLHTRPLFIGVFLSTTANFVFGSYEAILVFYMRDTLHLSAGWVGAIMAIAAAASVAVAALLTWRAPAAHFALIMTGAIALQGVGVVLVPAYGAVSVLIGQLLLTASLVTYTVYWRAFRQTICAPNLLGRVSGACRAIAFAGAFLGSLVSSGLLAVVADIRIVIYGIGAVTLGIGAIGLALLRRYDAPMHLESRPATPDSDGHAVTRRALGER